MKLHYQGKYNLDPETLKLYEAAFTEVLSQ